MDQIQLAQQICQEAHYGQVDKAGKPYYLHPFTVADMCESEEEKVVAYLHDVLEDSEYDEMYLRMCGFSEKVVDAVKVLTKELEEEYIHYIDRISQNKLATTVKLADLSHNMDISRIEHPVEDDYARIEKYRAAMKRLLQGNTN
nr:GTP pyrophosphokinase [uncultured Mogibacterium sp.]